MCVGIRVTNSDGIDKTDPTAVADVKTGGKEPGEVTNSVVSLPEPSNPAEKKRLQQLTQHAFVGKGLFARVSQVDTLITQAKKNVKRNPEKVGQILLDIILNSTGYHEKQNQHPGLNVTVQQQVEAYQLLVQYDCPQKLQAHIGMVYGDGTFKSAEDILYAAEQIESFGGHVAVSKATFLDEALYSLAVMDVADAAKLGIAPKSLVEAAITLRQVERTFTAEEKASLPNPGSGGNAYYFAASEMQKGIATAATLEEKIEFAALYSKIGYTISDQGYVSPCFEDDMQPIANDESLQWNFHEPKGYWARLLFNDLKVQTWTDVSQIDVLFEGFEAQGIDAHEMRADCLSLLIGNESASLEQRQQAKLMLAASGSPRFDIKIILADTKSNYDNSCWDVVGLYLKAHPELNQGYQSQIYTEGFQFGQPREAGVTTAWGQFITSMQSLGLMSGQSDTKLVYYAIADNTVGADNAKEELMFMASVDPKNEFADRYECCQELGVLNSDLQFQAQYSLDQDIKHKRAELRLEILKLMNAGELSAEQRLTLGELREEDRRLYDLQQINDVDLKS